MAEKPRSVRERESAEKKGFGAAAGWGRQAISARRLKPRLEKHEVRLRGLDRAAIDHLDAVEAPNGACGRRVGAYRFWSGGFIRSGYPRPRENSASHT
ncbi:hypothetical protein [Longimicrobium terrae]|uniref:hypothetical protein n=1 Tax=Longimicrobium terrae TaxID=1639882 RepID=UPI00147606E7|nr:hypothetical protein [Longimicrobium terrae]MBB4634943.1 hypothetical protein [Longimicrobium terrae]NNC31854.1 hypothetical protein [Longimicrobium terrae]